MNRSRWDLEKTTEPEKVVGFRMPRSKYQALKAIAVKTRTPIATLINEALEARFKFSKKKEKV